MSNWQTEKAERNKRSLARLSKSLPEIFPPAALIRALSRPFIPPTPRLAIDSYWRSHPLRADRLVRLAPWGRGAVLALLQPPGNQASGSRSLRRRHFWSAHTVEVS